MTLGIQRIVHVNLNCADLERSLHFFEHTVGLTRALRTAPTEAQPGDVFSLPEAQWDAWILTGASGMSSLALDLLQWIRPTPELAPPRDEDALGLSRLVATSPGGAALLRDPDGALVEVVTGDRVELTGVVVNASNPSRTAEFYGEVLALTETAEGFGCNGAAPWVRLRPGDPSTAPHDRANRVGYFRLAFIVDDVGKAYEQLLRSQVRCLAPPGNLDLGPGVPPCSAVLFTDPDGTVLELIGGPMS